MTGRKVVLVGMPGAGKSTFGRRLAQALDYDFVDLDDIIEDRSGQSIPALFEKGEEYFRAKETEALEYVMNDKRSMVIASGGGTPCFNDNVRIILSRSISLFLDPPMSVLVQRTEKEGHRPLLQGQAIADRLQQLYDTRKSYYEKADIRLTTEAPDPKEVVNLILAARS